MHVVNSEFQDELNSSNLACCLGAASEQPRNKVGRERR